METTENCTNCSNLERMVTDLECERGDLRQEASIFYGGENEETEQVETLECSSRRPT